MYHCNVSNTIGINELTTCSDDIGPVGEVESPKY